MMDSASHRWPDFATHQHSPDWCRLNIVQLQPSRYSSDASLPWTPYLFAVESLSRRSALRSWGCEFPRHRQSQARLSWRYRPTHHCQQPSRCRASPWPWTSHLETRQHSVGSTCCLLISGETKGSPGSHYQIWSFPYFQFASSRQIPCASQRTPMPDRARQRRRHHQPRQSSPGCHPWTCSCRPLRSFLCRQIACWSRRTDRRFLLNRF